MIILSDGHDEIFTGAKNKTKYPDLKEHFEIIKINDLVEKRLKDGAIDVMRLNADSLDPVRLAGHTGGLPNSLVWKVKTINALCDKGKVGAIFETHLNAMPSANTGRGHEVIYAPGSAKGKILAEELDKTLDKYWPTKDRNVKTEEQLYLLNKTRAPAVIIEPFFIDSDLDVEIYLAKMDMLVIALAEGIVCGMNRLGI